MQGQASCLNDDDGRRRVHVVGSGKMLNENEQQASFLRREAALAYPQGLFPSRVIKPSYWQTVLVVLGLTADLDVNFFDRMPMAVACPAESSTRISPR